MSTNSGATTGIAIKLERAKEHVRELQTLVQEFLESNPYRIVTGDDAESGDLVYSLQVVRQPPLKWGAIVGDALHNLRSVLDLMACELVRANGGPVTENTNFPIGKDVHALKSMITNKIGGARKEAIARVRAMDPYKGGNDTLWLLHSLNNIDKHRILLIVGSAHRNLIFDFAQAFPPKLAAEAGFDLSNVSMPIPLQPVDRRWPLQNGTELFRVLAAARESHGFIPRFTFEIAFGDSTEVEGKPILETLDQLIQSVEYAVLELAPFLETDL
jgi:hypothetical protein